MKPYKPPEIVDFQVLLNLENHIEYLAYSQFFHFQTLGSLPRSLHNCMVTGRGDYHQVTMYKGHEDRDMIRLVWGLQTDGTGEPATVPPLT